MKGVRRLLGTFFGLTIEHLNNCYKGLLMMNVRGNWGFSEAYNLPIPLRDLILEEMHKEGK